LVDGTCSRSYLKSLSGKAGVDNGAAYVYICFDTPKGSKNRGVG